AGGRTTPSGAAPAIPHLPDGTVGLTVFVQTGQQRPKFRVRKQSHRLHLLPVPADRLRRVDPRVGRRGARPVGSFPEEVAGDARRGTGVAIAGLACLPRVRVRLRAGGTRGGRRTDRPSPL